MRIFAATKGSLVSYLLSVYYVLTIIYILVTIIELQ